MVATEHNANNYHEDVLFADIYYIRVYRSAAFFRRSSLVLILHFCCSHFCSIVPACTFFLLFSLLVCFLHFILWFWICFVFVYFFSLSLACLTLCVQSNFRIRLVCLLAFFAPNVVILCSLRLKSHSSVCAILFILFIFIRFFDFSSLLLARPSFFLSVHTQISVRTQFPFDILVTRP